MKSLLHKGKRTLENDGLKVFIIRLGNYGMVKLKRLFKKKDLNNLNKWAALKDKYDNKRIFIIGNGPSLNKMPLYLLEGEYTMAFNRFNLMLERLNWLPQFYMVIDDLVIKDMYQQINDEILPLVDYAFFPDIHPSNVDFTKYIKADDKVHWTIADRPEFSDDMPNCGHNKTVVNAGIQVAAYLGFKEIYLIGTDMNFEDQKVKKINSRNWQADDQDPNHFDPRYFGKGLKYHNPTVHEMLEKFRNARDFFDLRGVKIYNATDGGKLEEFPRVNFESLFEYSDEEKKGLLENSKLLTNRDLNFDDLKNSPLVEEEGEDYPKVFQTRKDFGVTLIPKLILSFLPLGPYLDSYFFVKR